LPPGTFHGRAQNIAKCVCGRGSVPNPAYPLVEFKEAASWRRVEAAVEKGWAEEKLRKDRGKEGVKMKWKGGRGKELLRALMTVKLATRGQSNLTKSASRGGPFPG